MTINTSLDTLLSELEAFGIANDAAHTERGSRMLNITRDTGELLAVLIQARGARRLLEIGTSNGYSTLWLARAAQALQGKVVTVEQADDKYIMAQANFARAPFREVIEQKLGDAMSGLANVEDGILAVDDLIDQLYQGNWNTPRAASEMAGASILVRALVELKGQPVEKVKDFVKAKSAAERTALRNAPAVKAIIERLEAEKVAKAGNIDADELLNGL